MPSTPKKTLTPPQRDVLYYILDKQRELGYPPTRGEIQLAFGYTSKTSVVQIVRALEKKGHIKVVPGIARGITTVQPPDPAPPARPSGRSLFVDMPLRGDIVDVPLCGDIRAGLPVEAFPSSGTTLPVPAKSMRLTKRSRPFALRAKGTSMIGKGILDGDYIVLDAARAPHSGDVVAALIDGEATLKTLVKQGGQLFLKAENPEFKLLKPKRTLEVQGVMVGLIRGKP